MSGEPVDSNRRQVITAAISAVGGVGVGAAAIPFAASLLPSAKARAAGADVEVDISDLGPGEMKVVEWRRMPVWILRRTPDMLKALAAYESRLKDPSSERESQQPEYARNAFRSIKPEYLVVVGVCTHLGCSPRYMPRRIDESVPDWWAGGFRCPCHKSIFDLAGRVFQEMSPAPMNLPVPPYQYLADTRIRIGDQTTST